MTTFRCENGREDVGILVSIKLDVNVRYIFSLSKLLPMEFWISLSRFL
jgi:hypothetical protein